MIKLLVLFFFLIFSQQTQEIPFVISSTKIYQQQIQDNPNQKLEEIIKIIPSIKLDIKYATKDNFASTAVYHQAKAFARKRVVAALANVQKELAKKGLGLKVFDAYRPYAVTVKFWEITPSDKKEFVANPKTGSRHNRGCAVDLTLIDLKTGIELEMPTPYDSFAKEASPTYDDISQPQKQNRNLLISVMESKGFKVIKNEWWHFDFKGWEDYPLMDIPFRKL